MKDTIDAQRMTFGPDVGDTLRASCVLQPGAGVPMHVHLREHERFEVRAGALEVWIDGERQRCLARIPPGLQLAASRLLGQLAVRRGKRS